MKLRDILQGNVLISSDWLDLPIESLSQMYAKSSSGINIVNGVGIYSIDGPIMPDGFTSFFGGGSFASYKKITTALNQFVKDPDVKSIVLVYNTPGGTIDELDECSSIISGISKIKPITSFVPSLCASAGYWLAVSANEVVLTRTARLGSIGVLASVPVPDSERSVEVTSTISPEKRIDPRTPEGKKSILKTIDPIANIFVETVAKNRGVSFDYVVKNFGRGGLLAGQECVDTKMADRIVVSFDDLLKEKSSRTNIVSAKTNTSIINLSGGIKMDLTAFQKEHPDLYTEIVEGATKDLKADLATKTAEAISLKRKNEASSTEKTDLQAKVDAIAEAKASLETRVQALERDLIVRAEAFLAIKTSDIVNSALTSSQLPERLHEKIKGMIKADSFVKDGKLDEPAFKAFVNDEIKVWTEEIASASPVQGISSNASVPSGDSAAIADRMFAYVNFA